jgi:hypothetical protein
MKRLIAAVILWAGAAAQPANADAPRPRVALIPFIAEDNSYRSAAGLANFTDALQAELSSTPGYQWVERAELDRAAKELKLQNFGVGNRSELLHGGHWVNADWEICGYVATNSAGHWIISLDVVDLQRADILASESVEFATETGSSFKAGKESLLITAGAARRVLNEADAVSRHSADQDKVAFLFLARTGSESDSGDREATLRSSLAGASAAGQFHLIQFRRAGEAMDEAGLVLSGLAEFDENAWEKVADHFVWGTYETHRSTSSTEGIGGVRTDLRLEARLTVWDGRSQPEILTVTVTNETSPETVAKRLMQAVIPHLKRAGQVGPADGVRRSIASSLLEGYEKMRRTMPGLDRNSPEARRAWLDAVQMLETACFFDPANSRAREEWLLLRWGKVAPYPRRAEFSPAIRRSAAWGKYVEDFGLKSAQSNSNEWIAAEYLLSAWRPYEILGYSAYNQAEWGVPQDVGGDDYVDWKDQLGREFINRLEQVPEDPALARYLADFFYFSLDMRDPGLRARAIRVLWPRIMARARAQGFVYDDGHKQALKQHFAQAGDPGGYERLLADLNAANAGRQPAMEISKPPIRLLRAAELGITPTDDIFSLPPVPGSPPLMEAEVQTIPFPVTVSVQRVNALVCDGETVWMTVQVSETLEIDAVNNRIGKDLRTVSAEHSRLWKLDIRSRTLEPIAGPLATDEVTGLLLQSNTLWLTLRDAGLAAVDVKTGQVRRFGPPPGSPNEYALANSSRGIIAISGTKDLSILKDGTAEWTPYLPALPHQTFTYSGDLRFLAGSGNQLLLYNSQLLLHDLGSNQWKQIASPSQLLAMGRITCLTGHGSGGFFVANAAGLHQVCPGTGEIRSQWIAQSPTIHVSDSRAASSRFRRGNSMEQVAEETQKILRLRQQMLDRAKTEANSINRFVPNSRLSHRITSLMPDHDFLWIFTDELRRAWLYEPAGGRWVGGLSFDAPGTVSARAAGGGKLWVAANQAGHWVILEVDAGPLKLTPRDQWLSDQITAAELSSWTSSLSERERAVYYFFSGDTAGVMRLLQTGNERALDSQSLFLLRASLGEMGESNRVNALGRELIEKFPDSIFSGIVSAESKIANLRAEVSARVRSDPPPNNGDPAAVAAWMVRVFDTDNNGLNEDELIAFFEQQAKRSARPGFGIDSSPADSAAELLSRCDANHDGRIQLNELMAGAARHFLFTLIPVNPGTNHSVPLYHP